MTSSRGSFDVEALLDLWSGDAARGPDPVSAFRALYTDPVTINGTPMSVADLVARAVAVQDTFDDLRREVLDVCEGDGKVAVAFRMGGRQTGPLATSAGVLQPTGQDLTLRVIDILTIEDGRISSLWMVADELGALAAIDAVGLSVAGGR